VPNAARSYACCRTSARCFTRPAWQRSWDLVVAVRPFWSLSAGACPHANLYYAETVLAATCCPACVKDGFASRAGKTTLLDVLAGRKTQGEQAGRILFAGQKATQAFLKRFTGEWRPFIDAVPSVLARLI